MPRNKVFKRQLLTGSRLLHEFVAEMITRAHPGLVNKKLLHVSVIG